MSEMMAEYHTDLSLDEAISRLEECPKAELCAREEACYRLLAWAREERDRRRDRLFVRAANDPGEVEHYAPRWGWR